MQFSGVTLLLWHFLIAVRGSPIISIRFVLSCPVIILFLPAHSHLFLSSFVLMFVLCVSSLLFCLLSVPSAGLLCPWIPSLSHLPLFSLCFTFPSPPPWRSVAQCGFFKRSEPRRHYETEYYRAHLGVQPSEAEKQASEL